MPNLVAKLDPYSTWKRIRFRYQVWHLAVGPLLVYRRVTCMSTHPSVHVPYYHAQIPGVSGGFPAQTRNPQAF